MICFLNNRIECCPEDDHNLIHELRVLLNTYKNDSLFSREEMLDDDFQKLGSPTDWQKAIDSLIKKLDNKIPNVVAMNCLSSPSQ